MKTDFFCALGFLLLASPAFSATAAAPSSTEDWRTLASALHAPGATVVNPCLSSSSERCERHALTRFFEALQSLKAAQGNDNKEPKGSPVRVVVFGNSLISADGVVSVVRQRLVERFGESGRGLVLADRLGPWGPRVRTGFAKGRWELSTVGMLTPPKLPHGITGAQHVALAKNARTLYSLQGETWAQVVWFSAHVRSGLRLDVDGKRFGVYYPLREGDVLRTQVELPADAKTLELIAEGPGLGIQSVVLERPSAGVVVDTLGVPSVDASLFLRTDEALFSEQLRSRDPALVMVMLGGNEVKRLAWGKAKMETVEADLRTLLRRAIKSAPRASCLVVSPIDSVRGPSAKNRFEQRPELAAYLGLQQRVAAEEQCAWMDLFGAMGGTGSLQRFHARGFVHPDLVHPKGRGLEILGELLASALLRAWDDSHTTVPAPVVAGGPGER